MKRRILCNINNRKYKYKVIYSQQSTYISVIRNFKFFFRLQKFHRSSEPRANLIKNNSTPTSMLDETWLLSSFAFAFATCTCYCNKNLKDRFTVTVICPFTCTDCQCSPCSCITSLINSGTITSNAPPMTAERVNFPPGTIGGTGASNSSEYLSDQDIAAGKTPNSTRTEKNTCRVSVHSTEVWDICSR